LEQSAESLAFALRTICRRISQHGIFDHVLMGADAVDTQRRIRDKERIGPTHDGYISLFTTTLVLDCRPLKWDYNIRHSSTAKYARTIDGTIECIFSRDADAGGRERKGKVYSYLSYEAESRDSHADEWVVGTLESDTGFSVRVAF
jgi:hypothetical protein